MKIKSKNVNIAATIDITLAFRAHWDNMTSCRGGGWFPVGASSKRGQAEKGQEGTEARKLDFRSRADTQREGGMFIDFSHTHIVKRNCGASL